MEPATSMSQSNETEAETCDLLAMAKECLPSNINDLVSGFDIIGDGCG